jgi:cytochrome oxidase Cu insertion factor (SCO1/SenC/PrrC family)
MARAGVAALAIWMMMTLAVFAADPNPPYGPLNVRAGEKAHNFSLPSADGTTVSLSQFRGKIVLLDLYEGYW